MFNARFLFLLIMTILVVSVVLIVRSYQVLYKALPVNFPAEVTAGQFDDWRLYRSDSGNFTVMMPGLTQNATETAKDPRSNEKRRYEMYVAQRANGNIFMITLITFPSSADLIDPSHLFESVMSEMLAANPDNQLESKEEKVVNNKQTFDFVIQGKEVKSQNQAFINGKTLYLLSYMSKPAMYDKKEFDYFVNSFTLSSGQRQIPAKAQQPL